MGRPMKSVFERNASATKTPLRRFGSFSIFATKIETARQISIVISGTSRSCPISSISERFRFFWMPTIVFSGTAMLMT